jgi:heme-degrading monooxygenase HmoA
MWYSIFEAIPEPDKGQVAEAYYRSLLPKVKAVTGFVKDTFLGSPHTAQKAANIAEWKDADAISQWRNEDSHLRAQGKGTSVYQTYRLRLGPGIEADAHRSETARHFVVLYYRDSFDGTPEDDVTSLLQAGAASTMKKDMLDSSVFQGPRTLWVSGWKSQDAAENFEKAIPREEGDTSIIMAVNRDYTKSDRKDAPSESPGGRSRL